MIQDQDFLYLSAVRSNKATTPYSPSWTCNGLQGNLGHERSALCGDTGVVSVSTRVAGGQAYFGAGIRSWMVEAAENSSKLNHHAKPAAGQSLSWHTTQMIFLHDHCSAAWSELRTTWLPLQVNYGGKAENYTCWYLQLCSGFLAYFGSAIRHPMWYTHSSKAASEMRLLASKNCMPSDLVGILPSKLVNFNCSYCHRWPSYIASRSAKCLDSRLVALSVISSAVNLSTLEHLAYTRPCLQETPVRSSKIDWL